MPSFWKKPSDESATGDAEVIQRGSRCDLTGILYGALHARQEIFEAASAAIPSLAIRRPMLILTGMASSRYRCRNRSGRLAERGSQQAGAQEHEAGRGQGKKSVGDNVVAAHDTPTTQMLARIY